MLLPTFYTARQQICQQLRICLAVFSRGFRLGVYYNTKEEDLAYSTKIKKKYDPPLLKLSNVDALKSVTVARSGSDWWGHVKMGPPDVILGITEAYRRDTDPKKVNLGVGAYRDDDGKPWVLPCVRKAEERVLSKNFNHEYAPIAGDAKFTQLAAKLAFGDNCNAIKNKTYCTVQSLSGTGALRLGLEFITKHYAKHKCIYMTNPTWGNHQQICNMIGLKHAKYRYYDPKTRGFDLEGCLQDICQIPEGSIILFHACAHNPTGVDPNKCEWKRLSEVVKSRKLLPFFDMAYQGFATGDVDGDAAAVRLFAQEGHQVILAQSFAKNMGLYGERVGALTFLCGDKETAAKMMSQVKIMIRAMYSNPPLYGARLVTEILGNKELNDAWLCEVKVMADRVMSMRKKLRAGIEGAGSKLKWNHITDQIGMFCYTGLTSNQVAKLTKDSHIYLTKDGRISVAGISSKNVNYVAESIHKVTS